MSEGNDDLYHKLVSFIKESNDIQTAELRDDIHSKIENEIAGIRTLIHEEVIKRQKLEERQSSLETENEHILRSLKKNNLLIFGLDIEGQTDIPSFAISKLNTLLNLELSLTHFDNIYPIGKSGRRPVVLKLVSYFTKLEILKKCRLLKNTGIGIAEDLTLAQRQTRKILMKHRNIALEKGYRAHIKTDFLYINGEKYTLDDLEKTSNEENLELEIQSRRRVNSDPARPSNSRIREYTEFMNVHEGEIENTEEESLNNTVLERTRDIIGETDNAIRNKETPNTTAYTSKQESASLQFTGPLTRNAKKHEEKQDIGEGITRGGKGNTTSNTVTVPNPNRKQRK